MNIINKIPKQPISVLVVLHDQYLNVLLLERADRAGYWQSVTGSIEAGESLFQTALREVKEETGIILAHHQLVDWQQSEQYEIYAHWRHRYAKCVRFNTEHVFSACIHQNSTIILSSEHTKFQWLPYKEAAAMVFSASNQKAILSLPLKLRKIHSQI